MATLDLKVTEVFSLTRNSDQRITLLQGGTRSSKSISLAQLMLLKALTERNKRILICRKTLTALKRTLLKDFLNLLTIHNLYGQFTFNITSSTLTCTTTNTTIEFIGLDEQQKIQGLSCHYLVVEEAIEVEWVIFQQLLLRMSNISEDDKKNQCYLLYNPSNINSWIKTKIIDSRDDYNLIISTYHDNPFLTDETINEIEKLKDTDYDSYLVYARGEWASVRGQVFKNYDVYDVMNEEEIDNVFYGVDFGFSSDVTTCIKCSVKRKTKEVWLEQLVWNKGLTNPDFDHLLSQTTSKNVKLTCDSADPRSIEELRRLGWKYVQGVKKGPDSINFGIQLMKQYKIHINKNSTDLLCEFQNYHWIESKNGDITNLPIDDFNHGIDATRYIFLTYIKTGSSNIIIR